MLIILRFSLHFVPANSLATYRVQAHCRKSRRLSISVAWVATVQVKSSWKRSRGRRWAFWFQTKCSARCQVCYVTEALTDVHVSCKEVAILLYQMSHGAATPRHLVLSINKISTRTAWICFFFVTCLKWHVGIAALGPPIALVQWQMVSKWLPSTSKACSLCLRAAAVLQWFALGSMSCRMYEFSWCANNSTVLSAFCSSKLFSDIQGSGTLSKVEKTVNKRCMGCNCAGQKQLEEVERTTLSLLIPDEVLSQMPSLLCHRSTDWCSRFL